MVGMVDTKTPQPIFRAGKRPSLKQLYRLFLVMHRSCICIVTTHVCLRFLGRMNHFALHLHISSYWFWGHDLRVPGCWHFSWFSGLSFRAVLVASFFLLARYIGNLPKPGSIIGGFSFFGQWDLSGSAFHKINFSSVLTFFCLAPRASLTISVVDFWNCNNMTGKCHSEGNRKKSLLLALITMTAFAVM